MVLTHHNSGRITIVIEGMSVKTKSDPDLDSLAQLVEQRTFNPWVTGSSPVRVIHKKQSNNNVKEKTLKPVSHRKMRGLKC